MLKMINSSRENRNVMQCAMPVALCLLLTACGNKGDLFLPADQETLDQLKKAEQAIEDSSDPDKKKPNKK